VRKSLRKQLGPTYEWDTRKLLTWILGQWDVNILAGLNWLRTSWDDVSFWWQGWSTFSLYCHVTNNNNLFQYISNKMQRDTVYFIWKLLYMFRVVPPPIISRANNCTYSRSSNSSTIAAGSSNGMTNTRWCRYSCLRFWWWVEVPPETCRAVSR